MATIREQYQIETVDFEHDDHNDKSPTIELRTTEDTFWVQTWEGSITPECLICDSEGEVDCDKYPAEFLEELNNVALDRAREINKETAIERIIDNDEHGTVQAKAEKIAAILNEDSAEKFLILANTFEEADSISIGDAMVNLQIMLECSQKQSSDIVDLFLQ